MAKFGLTKTLVAALVLATIAFGYNEAKPSPLERLKARLRSPSSSSAHANAYAQATDYPAAGYHQPSNYAPANYVQAPRAYNSYYPPQHPVPAVRRGRSNAHAAAAASASSAAPAPVYVAEPVYESHYRPPVVQHHPAPSYNFRFNKRPVPVRRYTNEGAAAASSAAAAAGGAAASAASAANAHGGRGGYAGGVASAASAASAHGAHDAGATGVAHVVEHEAESEHYEEPETENTFAHQTGTYVNDGQGRESSSFVRATESEENHEDGKEDDNHYYNAHSYGKTYDENKHEAYANDDEDILHTPNLFRKKKSNTQFTSDYNKNRRESGSGVLAHDKHSASYNKDSKKFKENVDQRYNKEGNGVNEAEAFSSAEAHEDEDEERYDSDNLGDFVGVDGHVHHKHPGFVRGNLGGAASSSAASDGNGVGVATSAASLGQGSASASAGGASHS